MLRSDGVRILNVVALGVLLGWCACGCSGSRAGNAGLGASPATLPAAGTPVSESGLPAQLLPPPAALTGLPDAPRQTAYVETDLIKHGKDFDGGLPVRNTTPGTDNTAVLAASWPGGGASGLAFCIYRFQIPGYNRAAEVHYGWSDPPASAGDAWLGLADWDTNSWQWHQGSSGGMITAPSFTPFINGSDELLVAVVLADAATSELRWIRLGPSVLIPHIQASPATGLIPLEVGFDAGGSVSNAGTIEDYAWDWDGDGTYDDDTLASATASHNYAAAGGYDAAVRITSSYGEQATADIALEADSPWSHTWGMGDEDTLYAVATDGQSAIYAAGATVNDSNRDLLLLKYNLAGDLLWARSWGGAGSDVANDAVCDTAGNVYLAGQTESYGAGDYDALAQCWDGDGNLVWNHTWGTTEVEYANGIAFAEDMLYVAGTTNGVGAGGYDGLLLKYQTSGDLQFSRAFGSSVDEEIKAVQCLYSLLADATKVYMAGDVLISPGNLRALYTRFKDDGTQEDQLLWNASYWTSCEDIYATGVLVPEVYVTGLAIPGADQDAMLLQVGGDGLALSWDGGDDESAYGLLRLGDHLLLAGYTTSYQPNSDALLLDFSTSGALQLAEHMDFNHGEESCNALTTFPNNGMLMVGAAGRPDGDWVGAAGNSSVLSGSWTALSGTAGDVSGTTGNPSGDAVELTDGAVDTGGGGYSDGLIIARPVS